MKSDWLEPWAIVVRIGLTTTF